MARREKRFFHRKKKEDIDLYKEDMEYFPEDESDSLEEEYFLDGEDDGQQEEESENEPDSMLTEDEEIILAKPEKKKFSKKKLVGIGVVVLLAVIAVIVFLVRNMGGDSEGKAYVESVRVITGLGTANGANNRYTGEVDAQSSWKINLQADMSVEERYVNVGDQVKKGDKLFKYDTEELRLNKEKKELEQETMQNEINQLTKDIKSYQEDLKTANAGEKIELQTQILTAQTTIKKDQFNINSNKKAIEALKKNIKDATVTSKMDGLVKKINTSLESSSGGDADADMEDGGDSMDLSSGDGTGDNAYMTIFAIGSYRVKGTVSETNVWSLTEGDPVIIRSRVDDTRTWKGTISQIKTDTTSDENVENMEDTADADMDADGAAAGETASKYNFYVKLDSDEGLMMGQHVFIEQDTGQDEKKDGMWLPAAYVKKDGKKYYVWTASHNKLKLKKIEVGEYDEELDEYEIKSGLKGSDYIACDDSSLVEGMKVTKVNPEEDKPETDEEENDDETYDDFVEEDGIESDDEQEDAIPEEDMDENAVPEEDDGIDFAQ